MTEPEEERIRQLFEVSRRLEESEAPSFQATLAGARRRAVVGGHRKVLAAVTVMVVFTVLSLLIINRTRDERDLPSSRTVLYWESPTDAYLSAPGDGVLTLVAASEENRTERSKP